MKQENYFKEEQERRKRNPNINYAVHAVYLLNGEKKALCNGGTVKKYIDTWHYAETTCAGCIEKLNASNKKEAA